MSDSPPVLTYFEFRGLGEPTRLLFHDLGLPFEDRRIPLASDTWKELSPKMLFGQLPRLEIDGLTLFQSHAILRYLGRANDLCGGEETERRRCDVSIEAARDVQQRLWDHFWSPGSDTAEAMQAFADGQLAATLAPLERWLDGDSHFGGERLLFGDYFVLSVLDEAAGFFPTALEKVPALAAYRQRMYQRPGLAAYAASGEQSALYGFDMIRGIRSPPGVRS